MDLASIITSVPSLPLLFVISFLAATILPLGSEWLVVIMIANGFLAVDVVLTASLGNFLGACTTYFLGIWGSDFCRDKVLGVSPDSLARAERYYHRYGPWSLLLSWLPVIGDPLCFVAGIFRVRFLLFCQLVFVGKFSRYATLAFLTLQGTGG